MEDQLDSGLIEENDTRESTRGRGLGIAGLIIGSLTLLWSAFPMVGVGAWLFAFVGLILSIVAYFMARSGKNKKRGIMLTGIILNSIAIACAFFWIYRITSTVNDQMDDVFKNLDTAVIRKEIEKAMEEAQNDTTPQ